MNERRESRKIESMKRKRKGDFVEMEEKNTDKSKAKKQVPLRLSKKLYDEIAQWAEDDFRSMNGQIEYLLTGVANTGRKEGFAGGSKKVSA